MLQRMSGLSVKRPMISSGRCLFPCALGFFSVSALAFIGEARWRHHSSVVPPLPPTPVPRRVGNYEQLKKCFEGTAGPSWLELCLYTHRFELNEEQVNELVKAAIRQGSGEMLNILCKHFETMLDREAILALKASISGLFVEPTDAPLIDKLFSLKGNNPPLLSPILDDLFYDESCILSGINTKFITESQVKTYLHQLSRQQSELVACHFVLHDGEYGEDGRLLTGTVTFSKAGEVCFFLKGAADHSYYTVLKGLATQLFPHSTITEEVEPFTATLWRERSNR